MIQLREKVGTHEAYFEAYIQQKNDVVVMSRKRPLMILVPGGGYQKIACNKTEAVALSFLSQGYQVIVLHYSVAPTRYPESLLELCRTVAWAKTHAEEYWIDPERICVLGFSAGGHLAASLAVLWNTPYLRELTGIPAELLRPDRLILGYAVLTGGEKTHEPSVRNLMGSFDDASREQFSLESKVTPDTPPCFLWTTVTDALVPMENTMLFASALRKNNVPFELHIFSEGVHGLSRGDKTTAGVNGRGYHPYCACWLDMALSWLDRPMPQTHDNGGFDL